MEQTYKYRPSWKKISLLALGLVVLVGGGYFLYQKFFGFGAGEKTVHQLLVQIQIPKGDSESLKERYERGDVISVSQGEKGWSLAEKESFLIIKANITEKQAELLMQPKTENTGEKNENGEPKTKTVKLRRYGIDLAKLGIAPDWDKGQQIDRVFGDNIIVEKTN